jgi:MIP family channel proteins
MLRGTLREGAAEFLGTFLILVFGTASVAQKVLSGGELGSALSIHLSWGLGVTFGIYASAGVSGAHLNPAVTLALAAFRGFAWRKVPAYVLAQTLGAFAGAAVTFLTYREAFSAFDGGVRQVAGEKATAGIFATYPQPFLSAFPGGFVDQVVGTALLLLVIFALGDRRNAGPASGGPVLVGALVVAIGMTFGMNAGYAINPARDIGPRVFTALAGWGGGVFTAGGHWWWVPIVAPCLGAVLGGLVYDLLVTRHHPRENA